MTIHLPTSPAPDQPSGLFDFTGTWRFSRKITDRLLGQVSQGHGRLDLRRDGDQLDYHEAVRLEMPGQPPIEGTRRYTWTVDDPGRIAVLFEDGRPFHVIDLSEDRPSDVHHCDPDLYEVTYDLSDWPLWTVTYEVTGPRKDYRMETLFVRDRGV